MEAQVCAEKSRAGSPWVRPQPGHLRWGSQHSSAFLELACVATWATLQHGP